MKTIKHLLAAFAIACGTFSCGSDKPYVPPNTPTSGSLTLYANEGLVPVIEHHTYTFRKIYREASFTVKYVTEPEAIKGLFFDSCKAIAISRDLSQKEYQQFKEANLYINVKRVGTSAIACLVKSNSPDSSLSLPELVSILQGDSLPGKPRYTVIFDNKNSGATRYLSDSLLQGKAFGSNCHAVNNTAELLEGLKQAENTIGILDYCRISDADDPKARAILQDMRPLAITRLKGQPAYFPDQSNIQTGDYPLCQGIYLLRRSEDFSLGAGFITFVAGPQGQLMLLKTGLVPWRAPERVIEVNVSPNSSNN